MTENKSDLVIYRSKDGAVQMDVQLEKETLWLSQAQISKLFNAERSVITKHLRNVFKSEELEKNSVCAKFAHTAPDGKQYQTQYYNLDAIMQSFDGKDVYPSVEEKAANLLYFMVKNHSFIDDCRKPPKGKRCHHSHADKFD